MYHKTVEKNGEEYVVVDLYTAHKEAFEMLKKEMRRLEDKILDLQIELDFMKSRVL